MILSVCLVILTTIGGFLFWCHLQRKKFKSLSHFPGPKPLFFLGNALEFGNNPVEKLDALCRLQNQYGPITVLWFGPKNANLIISDPEMVDFLLSSTKHITKSEDYEVFQPWLGNGLLLSTGSYWHKRRKMITPAFHFKILEEFFPIFDSVGNIFIKNLEAKVGQKPFDIFPIVTAYTLDTICETAMGTSVNAQSTTNNAYVEAVEDMKNVAIRKVFSPFFQIEFIFQLSSDYRLMKKSLGILHGFTDTVIARKKSEKAEREKEGYVETEDDVGMKKRFAFLDLLLESKIDGRDLTDEEIRQEVDTFMFEGHDTTAAAIAFALYELAHNPTIQDKAYKELESIFGDDKKRAVKYQDLQDMKYLELIVKETLRLYPSVPVMGRQLTEDVIYKDILLPAGLNLMVFPFHMHRREALFTDAHIFNPDRFVGENVQKKNAYFYVPFSAGPRNCIGQKFAMMEMKAILAKTLLNFELVAAETSYPLKKLSFEVILRSQEGIVLSLKNRS